MLLLNCFSVIVIIILYVFIVPNFDHYIYTHTYTCYCEHSTGLLGIRRGTSLALREGNLPPSLSSWWIMSTLAACGTSHLRHCSRCPHITQQHSLKIVENSRNCN